MSGWSDKDFEEKMTSYIDMIYNKRFSKMSKIVRSQRNKDQEDKILFMDKELSIDTFMYFTDGSILTFQEKSRRNVFMKYNDFTFEYYNDPLTKEEGEWFKLSAQLYFYGYANQKENGFDKYYILNVTNFRLFLKSEIGIEELERKYLKQNKAHGRANFFTIPFAIIPDKCFLYKGIHPFVCIKESFDKCLSGVNNEI